MLYVIDMFVTLLQNTKKLMGETKLLCKKYVICSFVEIIGKYSITSVYVFVCCHVSDTTKKSDSAFFYVYQYDDANVAHNRIIVFPKKQYSITYKL